MTIEKGLKKCASTRQKKNALEMIQKFKILYNNHFLRRIKKEIFKLKSAELSTSELASTELPLKTDLVVWIPLNDI